MDLLTAIRLRALRNATADEKVSHSEEDYRLRRIFRWYSKEFHTPLHVVSELPIVHVLTAFYEDRYEEMEEEDLEREVVLLTETPEQRRERLAEEEAKSDDKFLEDAMLAEIAQEEQARSSRVNREPLAETYQREQIARAEPVIKLDFSSDEGLAGEVDPFSKG